MPKVIKIIGFADDRVCPFEGAYIHSVDFEADMSNFKSSLGKFTRDINKAKRFDNIGEALEFWKTIRHRDGLRPDGKPNRPLTAFTVDIINAPES